MITIILMIKSLISSLHWPRVQHQVRVDYDSTINVVETDVQVQTYLFKIIV